LPIKQGLLAAEPGDLVVLLSSEECLPVVRQALLDRQSAVPA